MAKKRITISIEEDLVTQLDKIAVNRSGFIQALVEGALAGFKTFLVPEGYQPSTFGHAPPPPPPPSATKGKHESDLERKLRLEAEYASAGQAGISKRKQTALTPEAIAFKGAKAGITSELEEVFAKARERMDDRASVSQDMRGDQLRIFAALKGEEE